MFTEKLKYYSAIKKNEILLFAAKWTQLEDISFSEMQARHKKTNNLWELKLKKKKGLCVSVLLQIHFCETLFYAFVKPMVKNVHHGAGAMV